MKKIFTLLLISLATNAGAQWTTDTTANTVVRDSVGETPLMASLPDGSTYVCWFEPGLSTPYELHLQLLDPDGNRVWGNAGIVVSNFPQNTALYRYDMKVDHDENAIIAFQDERQGDLQIVAYKIDKNGSQIWANGIVLKDSLSTGGLSPVIGITGHNDVVIAWTCDGNTKWIAAQKISAIGNVLWNDAFRIIDTVTNLKFSRPQLLPWIDDGMTMVYVQESGSFPGVTSTLFMQKIDASGNAILQSPVQVSSKTIPYFIFPVPVADDQFGFYIAFNTSNPTFPSLNDVYVQHVDSANNLWSGAGTEAAANTLNHKLAAGSCFVQSTQEFWVLLQMLDGAQGESGVNLQKLDQSGNVLLGADGVTMLTVSPDYYLPYTISDAGNGIIFTSGYGTSVNTRLFAMKTDYSGVSQWISPNVPLCSDQNGKDDVAAGKFLNNNLVIVWEDMRNGYGVYAQNITGDGSTGLTAGVPEIKSSDFVIYPNPGKNILLNFSSHRNDKCEITVNDITGKIIFEKQVDISQSIFSLSGDQFQSGIYFISVRTGEGITERKWVIE